MAMVVEFFGVGLKYIAGGKSKSARLKTAIIISKNYWPPIEAHINWRAGEFILQTEYWSYPKVGTTKAIKIYCGPKTQVPL